MLCDEWCELHFFMYIFDAFPADMILLFDMRKKTVQQVITTALLIAAHWNV